MQDTVTIYGELAALVRAYADEGLDHGQIYDRIESQHPTIVDAFIADQRRGLLTQSIRMIVGTARRRRFHRAKFADVAAQVAAGESVLLASFPSADGGRKVFGDMNKPDLLYAADVRDGLSKTLLSEARLLRAIARKVPKGQTVGEKFDPEQIAEFLAKFNIEESGS